MEQTTIKRGSKVKLSFVVDLYSNIPVRLEEHCIFTPFLQGLFLLDNDCISKMYAMLAPLKI